ncbi:MAG: hypothetical protein D6689_11425, partial [Deltaproteobacteria bacterium]
MEIRSEFKERLRRYRDWNQAIDDLERELDQIDDVARRSELLFDLAVLTEEVVPERDRALALYQRAWKIYPANIKALERAREVYRELGRLEMVAKVGELQLKAAGDPRAAAELAALVGEAHLDCGNRDRAVSLLKTALEVDPDSVRVRDALAAAEYDPELWADTVDRLVAEADKADSTTAARMLLRAARIVRNEGGDEDTYERLLKRVLEFDPQNEHANFAYELLLAQRERWDDLEQLHERRAYAAADDATRAALYRKFALEWVQRFKDRVRAAKFFAKAMEAASQNGAPPPPAQVAAFHLVREIFGGSNEWERVLALTDAMLGHLDDDRKLYMALQAGLIAWREMGDVERARKYFDVVRQLDPDAPELADFDAAAGPAAEAAEPAASETEPPAGPETDAEATQGAAPDAESTPAEAKPASKRKKRRRKDDAVAADGDAAPAAADAGAAAPDAGQAVDSDRTPPPVADEPDGAEEISDEQRAAIDAARALEAEGAPPDKVIDAWRKAIAVDPSTRAPRRELARVLRDNARWNALVEALKDEEARAAKTTEQKVRVLRELVDIYRDQLRLDVMVVNTLNQIHQLQPDDVATLDAMAAQYESMKRWPDLVNTLNKKAPLVPDVAERVALHLRIANLYLERFSNQAEAIKAFEAAL